MKIKILVVLTLLLTSCASGSGHPSGPLLSMTAVGMNLGIGDLVNRPDASQRMATYLDEIAIDKRGFSHEIRMQFDRVWGPQLVQTLVPVIRAKGFKLLVILTPGNQVPTGYDTAADLAWIEQAVPQMSDILIGVQLANEQWHKKFEDNTHAQFPSAEYVRWHNALTPTIRALAPGVPIVEGDLDGGWKQSKNWWEAVLAVGTLDFDVLSWHVYSSNLPGSYGRTVWTTESGAVRDCVAPSVKCFPYVWAGFGGAARFAMRPGGGILR